MSEGEGRGSANAGLRLWAFGFSVVAAFAMGLGALRAWATVGPGEDPTEVLTLVFVGVDLVEGRIAFACAFVLLIGALASRPARGRVRSSLAVAMIVAAVVGMGAAGATVVTGSTRLQNAAVDELVERAGAGSEEEARRLVEQAYEQLSIVTTIEPGLWITLAGGMIGFVGGILMLAWATRLPGTHVPDEPADEG
jgi:hypothetical protein